MLRSIFPSYRKQSLIYNPNPFTGFCFMRTLGLNMTDLCKFIYRDRYDKFMYKDVKIHKARQKQSTTISKLFLSLKLHEKCPNTEFFLVRIFPHLD